MAACVKLTANDSLSTSFNKSSSMNKTPRAPATEPAPTQQRTGGPPRNKSNTNSINSNGARDRATSLVHQQSSILDSSPVISAPSASNLNWIAHIPFLSPDQVAPPFVRNAAAVGPRLRYLDTNGHGVRARLELRPAAHAPACC